MPSWGCFISLFPTAVQTGSVSTISCHLPSLPAIFSTPINHTKPKWTEPSSHKLLCLTLFYFLIHSFTYLITVFNCCPTASSYESPFIWQPRMQCVQMNHFICCWYSQGSVAGIHDTNLCLLSEYVCLETLQLFCLSWMWCLVHCQCFHCISIVSKLPLWPLWPCK